MMDRRTFMAAIAALAASPVAARGELVVDQAPFSREWLIGEAERLSKQKHQPMAQIPDEWLNLSYDDFQHIWFDPRNAIWSDEDRPMQLDLFTAGLYFDRAVKVAIVDNGTAKTLGYDFSLFATTDDFPEMPLGDNMGYAGIRLRADVEGTGNFSEFAVFQGASYFRAIATGQNYGLSARGLALRTGDPNGEEFPDFTHFYVEAAEPGTESFIVHALLDSPSVTGAYTFEIMHGQPTTMTVAATLFPRVDLTHVGIAALTSMFLFDETNRNRFDDFRPAVHDSEGLLIHNGNGEQIWRPLANHQTLQISSFADTNPQGFGLIQRTRDSERYADLEAHYENRPSLWITPDSQWGEGVVELVEIPADKEIYDNIVAYWRPRAVLEAGTRHDLGYNMAWGEEPNLPDVAHVLNTRIGKGFDQVKTVIAIDFDDHVAFGAAPVEGGAEDTDLASLTVLVRGSHGEISEGILQRNPGTGGVRLAFSIVPGEASYSELRAQIFKDSTPVTEVWLYRWTA
ncbi:glucans biosynthesis protein [Cognatiyoonia koreensis]|uniref:Glucans biosynthesis protein n=1 Tax=Cognatiyoonia koreensis TaxID=364200 RepID=A0A1I0RM82_9RHOB|nr:glucan biosynthesis protein G [Cognatiyoonia koreensis]SEW42282.1 glucans biosynthesis protein [Cognatiyoonia koreensis]